ncbi:MAG: NAD(P)H-hydrate epimerase, partial [Pseudomonadota bacterium]
MSDHLSFAPSTLVGDVVPSAEPLYTAEQTRALDHLAIEAHGIPGIRLMDRAARAAFDVLLECWPQPQTLQVFCGTGNNGGDGFLIAALAHRRGIPVTIYQLGDDAKIGGDAATARTQAVDEGIAITPYVEGMVLMPTGVIVDAMLGTGLGGAVREPYVAAIEAINDSGLPVLAVDIPSGLCSDTGRLLGCAVRADLTVTFIGMKCGLFTLDAADCTGAIHFSDLAVPLEVYDSVQARAGRLELESMLTLLPPRAANAHKGAFGRVLVVGGDLGMAGAAAMAAQAAARCGAGLVYAATRPEHVPALVARCPEVMAHGIDSGAGLEALLQQVDV